MDKILQTLLEKVADLHGVPEGAYNIRANGQMAGRNTTANIDIVTREDGKGIDVHVKPGTKKESVHIPVILSQTGLNETVCNDFFVGDDADVGSTTAAIWNPATTASTGFLWERTRSLNMWKSITVMETEKGSGS